MVKITVIVPVYNVERVVCSCIESILMQTFTDYEVILVDDGSTDASGRICDNYAKKNSCIKVIHQKNQGQSVARNNAIKKAKGKWICFVDSDDLIHPQMLEKLYNAIINSEAKISMCSGLEAENVPDDFYKEKKGIHYVYNIDESVFDHLYNEGGHRCWVVWGKLIDKEIIEKIPFTAGRIYEDNAVVCRWLYEAQIVADINDELYFYYKNPNGITKIQFSLKKLDYLWALEEIISFYREKNFYKMQKKFCNVYIKTVIWIHWKVLNELRYLDIAREISKKMKKVYHKNHRIISLSKEEKYAIYNIMYPRIMKIYRVLRDGLKKCCK